MAALDDQGRAVLDENGEPMTTVALILDEDGNPMPERRIYSEHLFIHENSAYFD